MARMADRPDFEREGLLEGAAGAAREARLELLERLADDGVEIDELRAAVEEGRLALLPVERVLAGEPVLTPHEVAERAGVPYEQLLRQWRALGMSVGEPDAADRSEEDLEAALRVRRYLDAGLDLDAMVEIARVMAMTMSQLAAASRQIVAERVSESDADELETAERFQALADGLIPMVGPSLEHVFRLQLREQLRHAVVDAGGGEDAEGGERMTVAFADLVGFTRLGEELPPEALGRVTSRLDEAAREVSAGPVRLVKLIGDAAMFAAPEPAPLVEAIFALLEDAAGEEEFPELRAGVACGTVIQRAGDLYGRPVNLASRITGVARPGSVLVAREIREELDGSYRFSSAGNKRLRGISEPIRLYRCRRLDPADRDNSEQPDAG
jgi:adenylate cyclase